MSLANKVALVTGASSGIGAAIAITFSKEGAKVALVGRNEKKLKEVFAKCEENGGKPFTIVADVSKDDNVKKIINNTVNHFGQLDILVNNAGIGLPASITAEHALPVFDQVMAVNLRSAVYLTNLAAPHLIASKGNVVNVSSVAALAVPSMSMFAYSASKAGLDHFTRCAAYDLASKDVRCNTVNPGPVTTDILDNAGMSDMQQQAVWEMMKEATALKRVSDSEEVADLVLFLASDKAKGITGASFVVDNGVLLKGNMNPKNTNEVNTDTTSN